jgi:hypothetical protein
MVIHQIQEEASSFYIQLLIIKSHESLSLTIAIERMYKNERRCWKCDNIRGVNFSFVFPAHLGLESGCLGSCFVLMTMSLLLDIFMLKTQLQYDREGSCFFLSYTSRTR